VAFKGFTLRSVFTVISRFAKVIWVKFAARPRLCETTKEAVNLSDGGRPSAGILEILDTEASIAEI
jgi:hypothetical protein